MFEMKTVELIEKLRIWLTETICVNCGTSYALPMEPADIAISGGRSGR